MALVIVALGHDKISNFEGELLGVLIYKTVLIGLGFLLLLTFGGSSQSVLMIWGVATVGYLGAQLVNQSTSLVLKKRLSLSAVPLCFLLIVILNMTGWVGTLTGTSNSSGNFILLLAAPFYFLSIAAYFSDVSAGKKQQSKYMDYLLYVALPFKLLAGPVEQPNLLNQIAVLKPKLRTTYVLIAWPWVVLGVFMKFVIANRLDPAFNLNKVDPLSVLLTASVFELKFYFDFAGYSFMAYGLALMSGLKITHNFGHPFFAPNVVLFWRQWHMSLGRFLSHYVLEPNLKFIKHRSVKEVFASSIFIVSAMWHGGTINYLFWGLFHGVCYYVYIKFIKYLTVPKAIGIFSMLLFFIIGRFLATDANTSRLLQKIFNLANPISYLQYFSDFHLNYLVHMAEFKAVLLAVAFFCVEAYSIQRYTLARPYHFFRKPFLSLFLLSMIFLFSMSSGNLLYARI